MIFAVGGWGCGLCWMWGSGGGGKVGYLRGMKDGGVV